MKILQVIPSLEMGGAETMCEGLTKMLHTMEQEVTLVSLYSSETILSRRAQQAGIDLRFLDKKPGLDMKCAMALRRLVKKLQPDVIHVHLHALKYVAFAAAGTSIPVVYTVHSVAERDAEGGKFLNTLLFRSGKVTPVSLSHQVRKSVVEYYGLPEDQTPVIFNGIDLSNCIQKEDYSLHNPVQVIHVGRFWQVKNHQCIVEAAKLLKEMGRDVHFRFYGEGETESSVRARIDALNVADRVELCGVTDWVYPKLNEADMLVLPSVYEGMPMTIIEAMGTGLPIIASNVGGVPDMILSEHNGMLIPPDPEALANTIARLLDDDELRSCLGKNARLEAVRFSGETMARSYLTLYRRLCEN